MYSTEMLLENLFFRCVIHACFLILQDDINCITICWQIVIPTIEMSECILHKRSGIEPLITHHECINTSLAAPLILHSLSNLVPFWSQYRGRFENDPQWDVSTRSERYCEAASGTYGSAARKPYTSKHGSVSLSETGSRSSVHLHANAQSLCELWRWE